MGYSTTATAAGTTTLTASSNYRQFFTGTLAQTVVLPVTSTLVTGMAYEIENNSTGTLTVNSSGGNLVGTVPAGVCAHAVCIGTTLTTAADWDWDYISTTTITGTGANVLATSPTLVTPALGTPSALVLTNATGLPQAGLGTNVAGNGPAFSAYYSGAGQALSANTWTKLQIGTEEFDTNNNYDNATNYRFTPTIDGYYQVSGGFGMATTQCAVAVSVYKNGSNFKTLQNTGSANVGGAYGSALVYLNGSTDYIELYGNLAVAQNTNSGATANYFQAVMVRSA